MAFNINAQIILSQPKNLNNVTKQISKQLGKVTKIDLKIGNVQQLTNLNKQLTTLNNSFNKLNSNLKSTRGSINSLNGSFNKTSSSVGNIGKAQSTLNTQVNRTNQSLKTQAGLVGTLGKRFGSVAKQAIAFGVISRPIYDLQRALTGAVKDAVAFEREIVRISQVTGKTVSQLDGLTQQVTKLSKELGISANELAETSRVIAQAGIRGKDLEQVLTALARSTLAPTFGKITDTTEGLIAAFGQFGLKGKDAEAVLGSLNKVSKEFAVEAEDLISVIRRTGGVFAAAAGDTKGTVGALQELTAVFTAVRSTTRESADTIAAGLRTIFSRIQRRSTINFLQQFGVDLTDAQGKFVGIFPAFDQLSKRLDTLIKQGDALTLSAIAEELGGIRQIGKLLPAIAQFDKARKALTEAQKGAVEGLGGDVAKALDTIDNRVKRIRESFNALIRQVFESDAFQGFAKSILNGSQAIIDAASSIFSALEPILPLLTALGTVKLGRAIGGLASGALGGGLAGAASTVTGSATAQNTQKTAAAVVNQNTLISTTNSTLANMSRQLANLIQINNSGFNTLTSQPARGRSTVVTGFGGGRRRAAGGAIPKFADGGRVYGPSHAAGGVIAELEGGEYVIPKKYAKGTPKGGVGGKKNAYVFDFDDTLATTKAKGFKDFNDPSFIRGAQATRYASLAKRRARQGDDIHVLTARFGSQGIIKAIQGFMKDIGAPAKSIIAVGGAFKNEREPGKRPGTTRKIGTATKKAKILTNLSKRYEAITFLDDNLENLVKASEVKGVRSVEAQKGKLFRGRAAGGLIQRYNTGNLVTPGQAIVRRSGRRAEQEDIAQRTLAGGPKGGIAGDPKGTRLLGALTKASGNLSDNPDVFGGIFLRPPGQKQNLTGFVSGKDLSKISPSVAEVLSKKFKGDDPLAQKLRDFQTKFKKESDFQLKVRSLDNKISDSLEENIFDGVINAIRQGSTGLAQSLGLKDKQQPKNLITEPFLKKFNIDQVIGNLFEAILNDIGAPYKDDDSFQKGKGNANFDFPRGLTPELNTIFGTGLQKGQPPVDARSTINQKLVSGLLGKVEKFYIDELEKDLAPLKGQNAADVAARLGFARPASVGKFTDKQGLSRTTTTRKFGAGFASGGEVPVRISNGEMVVTDPKEVAANRGKLQSINKLATGGFASGTIARGPGTGTSDSIYTTLPAGAFVVNAASTKKYLGLRRGGLAGAGRASGAAFASGGETAGAGIGLIFALQSLTAGLGEGSETLSFFINSIATAAFAVQGLGLKFGGIGKTLENTLGKIPGVGGRTGKVAGRIATARSRGLGTVASRVAGFGGVGGTALAAVGGAAGGAVIGKIIGDVAGKAIADSVFGEQEELAGFKGSASAGAARSRGALEGGLSGLGAGAGAGAGLGFVLGGPVGAAIGAAIGGTAGLAIGAFVGEQNAALEQAAFEAAKSLQTSGEKVSKSLDELEKEFTISGFGDLTKQLGEQQVNFNDAVTKFQTKFNDEITITSATLDFSRAIPGVDAAFSSIDNLFGTTFSAANESRKNANKAFLAASKLINPDDIKRAKTQLNASLDKFLESFEVEDLTAASSRDLSNSLLDAANAGNVFAKNILKAATSIVQADFDQVIADKIEQADAGNQLAGVEAELLKEVRRRQRETGSTFTEAGSFVTTDVVRELFPQGLFENTAKYNSRVSAIVNSVGAQIRASDRQVETILEEAKQRGIVNKALKDTTTELQNIIKSLTSPFTDLEFQVQRASDSFDTFKANVDRVFAGQGGFQTRGIQAGAFGSDSIQATAERERLFRALDNITPGGSAGARASQRLRDQGPEIVKEVLKSARDTAASTEERLTPDVLLTRLETAFGNAGFQLPQGLTEILSGISREEKGAAIPEDILAGLIESDTLTQKFGEVFEAAAQGPVKFAESLNKAIAVSEKRIALEVDLLNKQRELAKSITELRIATEQRSEQILSGTSFGAPTGTEIPDAIDRLNRRVATIAGTADSRALVGRRGAALQRQAQLQQQIDDNPALALREDIAQERKALANEINQTTEALNLLATETEVFSKIVEKANRIGQNIGALETGLEDVINKVTSGDVAGVQQLAIDQATIGRAINGIATLPQALNALTALGQEQNRALVDVVTGVEGSGDVLRRNLLRQAGQRLAAGGGLAGQVAGNYLLGILQQEEKALALDKLQKERAAQQEQIQRDIAAQNFRQAELLESINNQLSGDAFANAVTKFNSAVDKFISGGSPAQTFASGGSIFKPRGTDTVPAMLTPGEFVVRKSAVDQYGTGMMEAINSGNAQVFAATGGRIGKGVLYRQGGGGIPDGRVYSQYGVFRDQLPFGTEGAVQGTGIIDPVTGEEIFTYKKGKGKNAKGEEVDVYYPVNQKYWASLKDEAVLQGKERRQREDQAVELVSQGKADSVSGVLAGTRDNITQGRLQAQALGSSLSSFGSLASSFFGGTQDTKPTPTGGGRPAALDRAATGLDPVSTGGGGGGRPAALDRAATGLDPIVTSQDAIAQTFPDGIPAPGSRSGEAPGSVANIVQTATQQAATELPDQFKAEVDRYFNETQFVFNNLIERGLKPSIRRRTDDIRNASFIQARKYLLDRLEVDVDGGSFSLSRRGQQVPPEQASLARKLLQDRVSNIKKQVAQSTRQLGLGINLLSFGGGFDPMQNRQFAGTGGMRADGTSPNAKVFDLKTQFRSEGGEIAAVLQSGEFVMNRQAVQRNGIGMLSRMNQGLPTFHSGGYVSGATQYRQAGGRIFGRNSNGPQSAVTVNGSDAAKELNNAIITGGETVKQSWQTLFDTVTEGLNSALGQISTIPNQINTTIAPIQIEGVNSFTDALTAQLVPKIIQQIAPLINANGDGNNSANQGDGLNSRNG